MSVIRTYIVPFGLSYSFLAFRLSIVLSDEHPNKELTDNLSLKVADILVNDEESNVSFIGSFKIANDTRFNDTELIKDIKFHYYSRWFFKIKTVYSLFDFRVISENFLVVFLLS